MSEIIESIPAHWYYDKRIFDQELSHIFAKQWAFVAPLSQLSVTGAYVTATVANRSIIVVRNQAGSLSGYYNLCRHRAARLCDQSHGQVSRFVCPYHAWCYGLNGELTSAPGFDMNRQMDPSKMGLLPIRVDSWNGLVFASLDHNAPDLRDWMGEIVSIAADYPGVEEMEFAQRLHNHGDVNWKNYCDNSAEGYHLATVHPGLNRALVKDRTHIRPYEKGQFVGFNVTYREDATGESSGFWVCKFPGLLMHFSKASFNIERITPVGSTQTLIQRWFWFDPDLLPAERKAMMALSDQVMREDMAICENVQKNLQAGVYTTGLLSSKRECGTIFFQQCVRNALGSANNE